MSTTSETQFDNSTIQTLFKHNLWANKAIFEICSHLSDEQLDSKIIGTYGTIRDTLIHIARAERSYLNRLTKTPPPPRKEGSPPPTLEELNESIRSTGEGLIKIAPTVQPQNTVEVNWDGEMRFVPSAVIVTQAINHATEHREQIKIMLTQIGIQPPDVDGWTFFDEVNHTGIP